MTHSNTFRACAVRFRLVVSLAAAMVISPFVGASLAFAQDPAASPTPTPLPQSGSLASTETGGFGGRSTDAWGGTALDPSSSAVPITASVSSVGNNPKVWLMKVFNNSKDSYTVDVSLAQKSQSGGVIRTDNYTLSLPPGASESRKSTAHPNSYSSEVRMRSWKKTSKPAAPAVTPTASADAPNKEADSDVAEEPDQAPAKPRKRIR